MDQALTAAAVATSLLGVILFTAIVAERNRKGFRQRLRAVVAAERNRLPPEAPVSVRREGGSPFRKLPLLPAALAARCEAELAATGNRLALGHLLLASAAAVAVALLLAAGVVRARPLFCGATALAAGIAVPILLLGLMQTRYRERFLGGFPDALDVIVRAVKAGLPVLDAIGVAAREIPPPVGAEFQQILDEMRIGIEIDEAFQRTAERIRIPDFQFFVVALALQRRTGGALAETLTNLGTVIRRRKEVRAKARAISAEAKATAIILGALPVLVGGALYLINPDLMATLITDPRGRFMLGVAILSLITGVSLMAVIINRSVR